MQAELQENDEVLRSIFLQVLEHHHPDLSSKLNTIYDLAQKWCDAKGTDRKEAFEELERCLNDLNPEEQILMASSFSHMLNLHNASEHVASAGKYELGQHIQQSFGKLTAAGKTPEEIYKSLCTQQVELVLTAHPTQAIRESVRTKYKLVNKLLREYNSAEEQDKKEAMQRALRASIQAAWRTDEIQRRKPTPQDEMLVGLSYMVPLFNLVPKYMRAVDDELTKLGQPRLPEDHSLLCFGSWMGGDRDGNPNVKPQTTRDVVIWSRIVACDQYLKLVARLMQDLTMWRCSAALKAECEKIWASEKELHPAVIAEERKRRNYDAYWNPVPPTEPYPCVLAQVRDKLYITREALLYCFSHPEENVMAVLERTGAYTSIEPFLSVLKLLHSSLVETKDTWVADTVVLDAIRQVATFGSSLGRLDIRQESTRHRNVMDAITKHLDYGVFSEWDEATRIEFITKELMSKRPLVPPGLPWAEDERDVVNTFHVLATLPPDSLGAYVISMAQTASDVLIVVLLQREFGVKQLLRVVPLFETLDDLNNAPGTMRRLFEMEWYREHIAGKQECMIGYSDSGKDAGRMAAAWALYQAQEKLVAVATDFNVHLTLFHGRGGTVGRGGAPAHIAVRSQPPRTVAGTMRVTVQGETIEQQLGEESSAMSTLDLYTASVLQATLEDGYQPASEFRELMQELADVSCKQYRDIVYRTKGFYKYFEVATPVAELGSMNIGSRPSKRKKAGGIESLRAIPWIFAWTQTRFHLPVWLGAGEALQTIAEDGRLEDIVRMYKEWPFFNVLLDMMSMVLAKADDSTLEMYENRLVEEDELKELGTSLRRSFAHAQKMLAAVVGQKYIYDAANDGSVSSVATKLRLRSPYVAPLNIIQAHTMASIREMEVEHDLPHAVSLEDVRYSNTLPSRGSTASFRASTGSFMGSRARKEEWEVNAYANQDTWDLLNLEPETVTDKKGKNLLLQAFKDTLMITIKGIAAGMQNTG